MKKYLYSTLLFCLFLTSGMAQQLNSNRTTATRIADLLAQMPAKDAKAYARNAEETAALGKEGIATLISRLYPTGHGDNSAIEYAVGGFTHYVTQPGKEEWRQLAVDAYTEALPKLTDKTNQAFILFQLQQVAKDKAVPTLATFLDSKELAGPAARALAKVGTSAAGQALMTAIEKPWGDNHLSFIEALGDMKYQAAAPVIERYATSNEQTTRKVAHYALAQIAAPSSEAILFNAAQKAGLIYDESDATAYYLRYLTRLLENGETKTVVKAAQTLMSKAGASHQVATRTAALKLLTDAQGSALRVATLVNAAGSTDAEYRAAALKYLQPLAGTATTALLLKSLAKGSPEVKADIIAYFGRINAKEALPSVLQLLSSKDKAVQLAAISTAGKVGGEAVFAKLVPLIEVDRCRYDQYRKNCGIDYERKKRGGSGGVGYSVALFRREGSHGRSTGRPPGRYQNGNHYQPVEKYRRRRKGRGLYRFEKRSDYPGYSAAIYPAQCGSYARRNRIGAGGHQGYHQRKGYRGPANRFFAERNGFFR